MKYKHSGSQPSNDTQNHDNQNDMIQKNVSDDMVNQEGMTASVQRQKARRLLTALQWLAFAVLLIGLIWLYVMQQRQYNDLTQRLQSNAQLTDRINVLEDKLVASSQTASTKNNDATARSNDGSNQSKAQLEQVRLQVQAANILSNNGQMPEAIQLLQGLHWQLQQKNNDIAPALTLVLSKSLDKDIAMLESISSQPDGWQDQALTIQAVQKFLYSSIHNNSTENSQNQAEDSAAAMSSAPVLQKAIISPRDAIIYDVLMQLNLAQQAASDKDATMLKLYLNQAVERLSIIERASSRVATSTGDDSNMPSHDMRQDTKKAPASQNSNTAQATSNQKATNTEQRSRKAHRAYTLTSITDASSLLKQLAQQPPKPIRLTTMQVIAAPEASITK